MKKGFTLIELLVVIAIIGILSSVVLASLNTARSKAKDASIQGEISSMRAQAEIYASANNNYGLTHLVATACTAASPVDMFNDTAANNSLATLLAGVVSSGGTTKCAAASASGNATSWAVSSSLVSSASSYACSDSSGGSYIGAKQAGITGTVASCQ